MIRDREHGHMQHYSNSSIAATRGEDQRVIESLREHLPRSNAQLEAERTSASHESVTADVRQGSNEAHITELQAEVERLQRELEHHRNLADPMVDTYRADTEASPLLHRDEMVPWRGIRVGNYGEEQGGELVPGSGFVEEESFSGAESDDEYIYLDDVQGDAFLQRYDYASPL
jgi:hypothetical protein